MTTMTSNRSSFSGWMLILTILLVLVFVSLQLPTRLIVERLPPNAHAIMVTGPSSVPHGLTFHPHCHEHKGEKGYAVLTYELPKTGQCIMTARLCHKNNPDYKLWLCLADPTGFVNGIFVIDDVIVRGGYGTRRKSSWFTKAGPFEDFWICPDGVVR